MTLDDEDSGDGLKLVSGTHGMDVPSACTIVIIAGNLNTEVRLFLALWVEGITVHCLFYYNSLWFR